MTLTGSDLGAVENLGRAIGLIDGSGALNGSWLSDPGSHLKSVLADDDQRAALAAFVEEVLGGSQATTDPGSLVWLPVFEHSAPGAPSVSVYAVLDATPASCVRIGLGVRSASGDGRAGLDVHVPLFRAAKRNQPATADPVILGTSDATVRLDLNLTLADPTVQAVGLTAIVPTDGSAPTFAMTLTGLRLPGTSTARDVRLTPGDAGGLERDLLDLVLGIVRAQVQAAGVDDDLAALAGLLGLGHNAQVPALPVEDLAARGVRALTEWFERVVADEASRDAWLGELAALLHGDVDLAGPAAAHAVTLTLGPARLRLGVRPATGSGGHPTVTPYLEAVVGAADGDVLARLTADLVTLDLGHLGGGAVTALPACAIDVVAGRRADGSGAPLLAGDPAVERVVVGLESSITNGLRPRLRLAAETVQIGGHTHAVLDLSSPDAIAQTAGTVLSDVADGLLTALGPVADSVAPVLGLRPPPGFPTVDTVDLARLFADPLTAVAGYWEALLRDHPDAVKAVLSPLRVLVADAARAAVDVAGSGTPSDPWRIALVGPVDVRVWQVNGVLTVALGAELTVATLGQGCTSVTTGVQVGLATLDMPGRRVHFASGIDVRLAAKGVAPGAAEVDLGGFAFRAGEFGLVARWRPGTGPDAGVAVRVLAPDLVVHSPGGDVPVTLPEVTSDGTLRLPDGGALDDAAWDSLEGLLGALGAAAPPGLVRDLVDALGWRLGAAPPAEATAGGTPRLRLASLMTDARTAIRDWLGALALNGSAAFVDLLRPLARAVTGAGNGIGTLTGSGSPSDPWQVPVALTADAPSLAAWLEPAGPVPSRPALPGALAGWQPSVPGLGPAALAAALTEQAGWDDGLADLLRDRDALSDGFDALLNRWDGSDGRVVPPPDGTAGLLAAVSTNPALHSLDGVPFDGLADAVRLDELLDRTPTTVVHVSVGAAPWSLGASADRIVLLDAPGLPPEAFSPPTPAQGSWYVVLAGRAAARQAVGDDDGIAGQAARLVRVLAALGTVDATLTVLASAEAGHAAVRAAQSVAEVAEVVTLGTPWSPVSFSAVDVAPAEQAVRLLAALMPDAGADTAVLSSFAARGRSLVRALTAAMPLDDPARELRAPAAPAQPPRPGLAVHAVFGSVPRALAAQALTALVAEVAAGRLADRLASLDTTGVSQPRAVRAALRLPLTLPSAAGVSVTGLLTLDLAAATRGDGGDQVSISRDRAVRVHLELRRPGRWLVGGPDTERAPGTRHDVDLRWVEADVAVPVTGADPGGLAGDARIVLHEARVFGLERARWVVRTPTVDGVPLAADEATPALPEVRVLLSALAEALTAGAATDPGLQAALAAMRASGVLDPSGGWVPGAFDHLLHDPVSFAATLLAQAEGRASLASALAGLLPGTPTATGEVVTWAAGPLQASLDLASRRVSVTGSGNGAVPWTVHAAVGAGAGERPDVQVVLGAAAGSPQEAQAAAASPSGAARLVLVTAPELTLSGQWARPGADIESVAVWPRPDPAAAARLLGLAVPADLARRSLEYLRSLDASVQPTIDAALDAVGLLAGPSTGGLRSVRLPLGLLTDPVRWLSHPGAAGGPGAANGGPRQAPDPAKVVALLDALRPILGLPAGDPGVWALSDGVAVRADAHDGQVRLTLAVSTAAFSAPGPADERLAAAFSLGLLVGIGRPPRPSVNLAIGLPAGAAGPDPSQLRRAVHVVLDDALSVFLRPSTGPDVPLLPNPPGLGALATAAAHALPLVLNALADETGNDLAGKAGALVRALGDAMALRTGAPQPVFADEALHAWAADPAGRLAARLPILAAQAIGDLATAFAPLLPAGVTVTPVGTQVKVAAGTFAVTVTAAPFGIGVVAAPTNIPGVHRVRVEVAADASGLTVLDVTVGPAPIDASGARLVPYARVRAGASPPGGRRVEVGLGLNDTGDRAVAARWLLGGGPTPRLALVALEAGIEHTEPERVARAAVGAVLDLVAGVVTATTAVTDLLARPVGGATIGAVVNGIVVEPHAGTWRPVTGLFASDAIFGRLLQLARNLVQVAAPALQLAELTLALVEEPAGVLGVKLVPTDRYPLGGDDITVSLEFDASWIDEDPAPRPGVLLRFLTVGADEIHLTPGIEVDGVGIRIARADGPLLDLAGVSLGSVALHVYAEVGVGTGIGGGAQLQLTDLAVAIAGATGGNAVPQGIMKDAGSGGGKLAPRFSPSIAVQRRPNAPALFTLRAGDPPGPWWLAIQRGFGPVYVEQVGLDARVEQRHLTSVSLLIDGRVSIFGLTASVDDLSLTYVLASGPVYDPASWAVDVAGFAISSDLGGLVLVGGLRKFSSPGPPGQPDTVQYIGMLLARFGVYGLSVFGGYGMGTAPDGAQFASFFAFGAVNGPIGGPPAFFLTGIGGGLGINRGLVLPTDLRQFGTFPFIQALDPASTPPSDPMAVLRQYGDTFPVRQGQFWFAAGISFTSFAVVDGVAVVAITVSDGFQFALLGLARMALPRPEIALVSIELGLVARFSTREGVLWIQAQLTDNSWLLFPQVRLTGGYAFVTWFSGPNRGQFVLTLGGFHPSFHRDGYPVVPRLGYAVDLGAASIKGGQYFALTSEAVMAGGRLEASADLGAAWAHVVFGYDGIIYFDPFFVDVRVYASIAAGVTVDLWFATITISVRLGAQIHVTGPEFSAEVTFDVGPVSLTVAFGDSTPEPVYIDFPTFVAKYLEEAAGGAARALTAITGRGTMTPKPGPGGPKDVATADGSQERPYVTVSEFELTLTSTVPVVEVRADGVASVRFNPSQVIGIAPMGKPRMDPAVRVRLLDSAGIDQLPALLNEPGRPRADLQLRATGTFPVGVWGLPQPKDARKVPAGEVIAAAEGMRLDLHAKVEPGLPPVNYLQVEHGPRRPLPFVQPPVRADLMAAAAQLSALVPADGVVLDHARHVLGKAGNSKTAITALAHDRAAPPRLGSLTEGLADDGLPLGPLGPRTIVDPMPFDHSVHPPRATAVLTTQPVPSPGDARLAATPGTRGTRVSDMPDAPRHEPATLAEATAAVALAVPTLLYRVAAPATADQSTVLATATVPLTRIARAPVAAVAARGAVGDARSRLDTFTTALTTPPPGAADDAGTATTVSAGEIAVLQLPNARRDAADGPRPVLRATGDARVVVLTHGGQVLDDVMRPGELVIRPGGERIVVVALGDGESDAAGTAGLLSGWHAGQLLPGVGWGTAVGSRCMLAAEGQTVRQHRQRAEAGWLRGAELVRGTATVTTRFLDRPRAIAVVLDRPVGSESGTNAPGTADGSGTADAGTRLAMSLSGATRSTDAAGRPIAPAVVASGSRSAVIYVIDPDPARPGPSGPAGAAPRPAPVTVTVAAEAGWSLVGVLAGQDVVTVTDTLTRRGVDAAVRPVTAGGGNVTVAWIPTGG
jgi:hypothetical protein